MSNITNTTDATPRPRRKAQGDASRAASAGLASIPDACAYAGCGRSTLYVRAAAGDLRMVKLGVKSLIDMDSLRAMIARLPEASLRQRN
jgi:hypothetical protein